MIKRRDQGSLDERRREFRQIRKALKLSQENVARFAGITQESISGFERGNHDLSPDTHARLQQSLVELQRRSRVQMDAALRLGIDPKRASKPSLLTDEQVKGIREKAKQMLADPNPVAAEIHELKEHIATMQQLINCQRALLDEFESACKDDILPELREKDARIVELEKQVADLRNLYEAETEAALAYDKARELRAKVAGREPEQK